MPVVTIQMAPPPPSPHDRVVLEACARAFGLGSCVWAASDPSVQPPPAIVATTAHTDDTVQADARWDGRDLVEIHVGQGDAGRTVRLTFLPSDPDAERYRAIGYFVGSGARAMVDSRAGSSETPARAASAPAPAERPAPASPQPSAAAAAGFALHVEPHVSVAPVGAYTLYGGGIGLSAAVRGGWIGAVAGRFRLSERDLHGIALQSAQALVGLGHEWHASYLGLGLRAGMAVDWMQASVRPDSPRLADSRDGVTLGAFGEGGLWFAPDGAVSGQLAAGFVARPRTTVQVDGQPERELGPVELSLALGLRVRLF